MKIISLDAFSIHGYLGRHWDGGVGIGQGLVLREQAQEFEVNEEFFSARGDFLQNADLRQLPEMARRSVPGATMPFSTTF